MLFQLPEIDNKVSDRKLTYTSSTDYEYTRNSILLGWNICAEYSRNNIPYDKKEYIDKIQTININELTSYANSFFNLSSVIVNQSFLQMWEILMIFSIINGNTLHINEIDGGFVNAMIVFQKLYGKSSNQYKYCIMLGDKGDFDCLSDSSQLTILRNKSNTKNFIKKLSKFEHKVNLITLNAFDNTEQSSYSLISNSIVACLLHMNINGCMVIKLNNIYTFITAKLLFIIKQMFTNIMIYIPDTIEFLSPYKFIVCLDYKKNNINVDNFINMCEGINEMTDDILPSLTLESSFIGTLSFINITQYTNEYKQYLSVIKYLNDKQYYGSIYDEMVNQQTVNTNKWKDKYLAKESEITNKQTEIKNYYNKNIILYNEQ